MKLTPNIKSPIHYRAIVALTVVLVAGGCGKSNDADLLVNEAKQAQSKGDYKTAIIQLKNALQANPDNGDARYQLGLAYIDGGDPRSAEKELRKALELKKTPSLVRPALAKAGLLQGEFQKVLIDTAIEDGPIAPEILAVRGSAQLALNKADEAKSSFEQALGLSPDLPDALLGQARLAVNNKDATSAMKLIDRVLEKSPTHLEALLMRGDLFRLQNNNEAALSAYQKVVDTYHDNLTARLGMATILVGSAKYDDAAKQLEAVLRTAPQNPTANYLQALAEFKKQNYTQARDVVQQVLKTAPGYLPGQMLAGAVEYALGNYEQTEQYLKAVIDKMPDNLHARKLLTSALLRSHQVPRAIDSLQPVLRLAPEDPAVLALAGEVYMQNNEFGKATQFYEKAAKIDPKNAQMRTGLGLSRLAAGDAEHAMADMEAATDLDANRFQANVMLILTHLSRGEFDQAEKAVADLEKKQPNNPLTYNLRGAVFVGKKKNAEARKVFEKALTLQPTYFPAALNIAQLDIQENNPQMARTRFETILAKDPTNLQALVTLAGFGKRINATPEEVLGWLERAKKGNPAVPQPSILLSRYYLGMGDAKKAVEIALDAQAISPENPDVLDALGVAQLLAGEKNAAVTTASKLVSLQPKSAMALVRLANAQYANDNLAGASASLRKALEIKPDLLDALTALVSIETRAGRYAEAMQLVKKVQSQYPKSHAGSMLEGDVRFAEKQYAQAATAYENAYTTARSGQLAIRLHGALALAGKQSEGEAKLTGWLKTNPDDLPVRIYLADVYLKQQKHKSAIEQYEYILKKQPQNLLVLNNLAWTYQQVKDPRSLQVAEQAYKASPQSAQVMDTYGWMLVEQGQIDKGLGVLQRAASTAPDQQEIRFHYASGLYRAGKKDQARMELERVLASGVKFTQENEAAVLLAQIKK